MKVNLESLEKYLKENLADSENDSDFEDKTSNSLFKKYKNPFEKFIEKLTGNSSFDDGIKKWESPFKNPNFKKLEQSLKSKRNYEDFVSRLIYYINLKDKKNPEVYNAAGMTPDCFSKIISGKTKTPKKENVVALAIALNLNFEEATDLLSSAGFSLYKEKADLIYRFCFENGPFTVDEVNEALVYFGCKAIGGR